MENNDNKWLEERDMRYRETFDKLEEKIDTFATELKQKMQELIDYVKQLNEKRMGDVKRIDRAEQLIEAQRDRYEDMMEWRSKIEHDVRFIRNFSTPIKFVMFIAFITAMVVVILTAWGLDPLIKLITMLK